MARRAFLPPPLLAVVAPVCLAGAAASVAAVASFAHASHSTTTIVGILALALASAVAQRYPVPVEGVDARGVNLGFVFGVAGIVLFGWAAGALIEIATQATVGLWERRPLVRVAFNTAVF